MFLSFFFIPCLAPGTNPTDPILFVCTTAYFIFCPGSPESSFDFNINSPFDFLSPGYQSATTSGLDLPVSYFHFPFPCSVNPTFFFLLSQSSAQNTDVEKQFIT